MQVAVIGAGAFGGWTALELARLGAAVTLLDAWGPANARASSGGDTRVLRAAYGTRAHYTRMTRRALELWREHEARCQRRFFHRTGVLWMFAAEDPFARASVEALAASGAALEPIDPAEARRRYPQIDASGLAAVLFEPDAGYLMARRASAHVVERFVAAGGEYRLAAAAAPVGADTVRLDRLALADGTHLAADAFVFACGPWLPALFPDVLGGAIAATRQEVYYFGPPAGDALYTERRLPVWIELGDRQVYGIPGSGDRGFKVADDTPGAPMDPTTADRAASPDGIAAARRFLARRFPALAGAPLLGAEVCQYESAPDADFVIDRHPRAGNVWIAGGGSGHGFKMGPAVGEIVASLVLGRSEPDPRFGLARFAVPPGAGWQEKWT